MRELHALERCPRPPTLNEIGSLAGDELRKKRQEAMREAYKRKLEEYKNGTLSVSRVSHDTLPGVPKQAPA